MVMYTRFNLNILTFRLVKQYGNHQEENSNTSVSLTYLTASNIIITEQETDRQILF